MTGNSRLLLVIPWLLSIALGAWVVVLLPGKESVSTPSYKQTEPGSVSQAPKDDLALLRTCRNKLKTHERKLAACQAAAAASHKHPDSDRSPEQILSDPRVQAMIAAKVEMALAAQEELIEQERVESRAGWLKLASRFLSEGLGLSPEESAWVGEYVCAVHELSARTGADVASTGEEVMALFARQKKERELILRDLEAYMGTERYRKLRAIGGLGFLGEALGCR